MDLDWSDVGSAAHDTFWDKYRYDGAWSVTQAPRGLSFPDVLTQLLAPHQDRLGDAKAAIGNRSAAARIVLRPVYGSQDSSFAGALPLGMVVSAHRKVPAAVRAIA